jgi:hypothetical protein
VLHWFLAREIYCNPFRLRREFPSATGQERDLGESGAPSDTPGRVRPGVHSKPPGLVSLRPP